MLSLFDIMFCATSLNWLRMAIKKVQNILTNFVLFILVLSVSLSLCFCHSLPVCLSVYLWVSVGVCVCLSPSFCLSVFFSPSHVWLEATHPFFSVWYLYAPIMPFAHLDWYSLDKMLITNHWELNVYELRQSLYARLINTIIHIGQSIWPAQ